MQPRPTFPAVRARFANGTAADGRLLTADRRPDGSARIALRLRLNHSPTIVGLLGGALLPPIRVVGTIPHTHAGAVLAAAQNGTWQTVHTELTLRAATLDLDELAHALHRGTTTARDGITTAVDQVVKVLVSTVLPRAEDGH